MMTKKVLLQCSGAQFRGRRLVFYEIRRILMCTEQPERPLLYIYPACVLLYTELQNVLDLTDMSVEKQARKAWGCKSL